METIKCSSLDKTVIIAALNMFHKEAEKEAIDYEKRVLEGELYVTPLVNPRLLVDVANDLIKRLNESDMEETR